MKNVHINKSGIVVAELNAEEIKYFNSLIAKAKTKKLK